MNTATGTLNVEAVELSFIDRASNSDKFYRTFVYGTTVMRQYGRNGAVGQFKPTSHTSPAAAAFAARQKLDDQLAKGYQIVKTATLTFPDGDIDAGMLDRAMTAAPTNGAATPNATAQTGTNRANATIAAPAFTADPNILDTVVRALNSYYGPAVHQHPNQACRPMLAATTDTDTVTSLLDDNDWCAQLKLDGDRIVVEVIGGDVAVYNRQGTPKTANVPAVALEPFRHLTTGRWVFDGEIVGRKLWLFDLIDAGGHLPVTAPFLQRHTALSLILDGLNPDPDAVGVVANAIGTTAKHDLLRTVIDETREGIILRRVAAAYEPGRRSTNLVKHKLVKEADCYVTAIGVGGKENAVVAVHDTGGNERWVGAVSTIGKGTINVGDVVEVRFLYVIDADHPTMVQPRIVRVRTDKTPTDCTIDQFADAATNKTV